VFPKKTCRVKISIPNGSMVKERVCWHRGGATSKGPNVKGGALSEKTIHGSKKGGTAAFGPHPIVTSNQGVGAYPRCRP